MISYDDILKLKKGLDEPMTDEPILYTDGDAMKVVGDPNRTEVKKNNYQLIFETEDGQRITKKYENIHITPRKRIGVNRLMVKLMPYFRDALEDGRVVQKTAEEVAITLVSVEDDVYDILYDLAGTILDVPEELKDYIDPVSLVAFGVKLVMDNPAVVKESDQSFGVSSATSR